MYYGSIQCSNRKKSYQTQFVNGTRSVTQALIDLKKVNAIDLTNVSFDSTAHPYFNGVDDYITTPSFNLKKEFSLDLWVNMTSNTSDYRAFISTTNSNVFRLYFDLASNRYKVRWRDAAGNYSDYLLYNNNLSLNQWYNIVFTYNNGLMVGYVNGAIGNTYTGMTEYVAHDGSFSIGRNFVNLIYYPGKINIVKIYGKCLNQTEVLQNFNAIKGRFNL